MEYSQLQGVILSAFTYISLWVVTCCFILHLKNHFGFILMKSTTKKRGGISSAKHQHICLCLYPLNGHIEFYPVSTLCYFLFLLGTIVLIILFDYEYYEEALTVIEYCPIQINILSVINNPFELTSLYINNNNNIEYIWSYIVLLLLLWETLFNFYRFYDSYYMTRYCLNASKLKISALFSIYIALFSILYLAQIHLYFGLFIILILLHLIFNLYCIVGFVSILKHQYIHLWEGEIEAIKNHKIIKDLLEIIHRVKKCSVITTMISSSFLFITTGCYTSYTIILLPGFWMISSIVWTRNFAKNESWINNKYNKILSKIKRIIYRGNNNMNNNNNNECDMSPTTQKLKAKNYSNDNIDDNVSNHNVKRKLDDNVSDHVVNSNENQVQIPDRTKLQNVYSDSGDNMKKEAIKSTEYNINHLHSDNKEIEEISIPIDKPPIHIGVTTTISNNNINQYNTPNFETPIVETNIDEKCNINDDDIEYVPKTIIPVFSYTQSLTNYTNYNHNCFAPPILHKMDQDENDNDNSISFQYPKEFEHEEHDENQQQETLSISRTKTITRNRKVLCLLGVIDKDDGIRSNHEIEPDGFPDTDTITLQQINQQTSNTIDSEEYNKIQNINISPVTPFSFRDMNNNHDFDLNEMRINIINNTSKSKVSQTPGPMRKDLSFGANLPGNSNNLNIHKRSLSTMSGLNVKHQSDDIAASSILDMMVNQGFYLKTDLNSVNQIRNLAL